MIKDILLIHHSHTDIGYTNYQSSVFALQVEHIRNAIYLAERYADNAPGEQFKWTCEITIMLEEFLKDATPQEIERLQAVHKKGLIDFGGMYTNHSALYTTDMLARSLHFTDTLRKDYDFDIRYALNCDINGHSWGIIDLLLDAGFDGVAMAINRAMAPDPQPRPSGFYWQAPSGRKILTWHGEHYGDGNNMGIPRFPHPTPGKRDWRYNIEKTHEAVTRYIQSLHDKGYSQDFALQQIISSYQWDNGGPNELLVKFVQDWNARGYEPRMSIITLDELFARIKTDTVRAGDWTDWWAKGINSSAFETALNRETHNRFYASEQLGAILHGQPDTAPYPLKEAATTWRDMAIYDEHTWGSSESNSHGESVQARGGWAKKATYAYDAAFGAIRLQQHVMRDLTSHIPIPDEPHAVLYNPLPWERQVPLNLPPVNRSGWELNRFERELEISSAQGAVSSVVDYGTVTIPAGGYTTIPLKVEEPRPFSWKMQPPEFAPRVHESDTQVEAHGWRLQNKFMTLHIDPNTGGIRSLITKEDGHEWVDSSTSWTLGHIIHETIGAPGGRMNIGLPNPPKDYDYRPHLALDYAGTEKVTEMQYIPGIKNGRLFLRVEAPGAHDAFVQIVIFDDLPYVDLIFDINKISIKDPESLYIAFPLNVPNPVPRYEVAGAIAEAGKQQLPFASHDYVSVQNWIDVSNDQSGVTIASPHVPLFHIGGFTNNRFKREISLEQPLLVSWPMNNHWWTNFKLEQSGWTRFHYRLWIRNTPFNAVEATRFGMDIANPPLIAPLTDVKPGLTHRTSSAPVNLPPESSLFSLEPSNVQMIGCQVTEESLIFRLQEIAGETAEYNLDVAGFDSFKGTLEPFHHTTITVKRS